MARRILALLFVAGLLSAALAQDSDLPVKKTGRPGQNTLEEEEKLDKIIDRFIQYDTGTRRDPAALSELNSLGPEAIPALIRGLNKAAKSSYSCPVATIAKKLKQLLMASEDERTLDYARTDIGAGIGKPTVYDPLFRDLKVTTMLRKKQLAELRTAARKDVPTSGSSYHSPGEDKP
jgi:hypothetical protein